MPARGFVIASLVAVVVALVCTGRAAKEARDAHSDHVPVIQDLEFARTSGHVDQATNGGKQAVVDAAVRSIHYDCALAPSYGLLFVSLGLLWGPIGANLSGLIATAGASAAVFDLVENAAMLRALRDSKGPGTNVPLRPPPRPFAITKWALFGVACALTLFRLVQHGRG